MSILRLSGDVFIHLLHETDPHPVLQISVSKRKREEKKIRILKEQYWGNETGSKHTICALHFTIYRLDTIALKVLALQYN